MQVTPKELSDLKQGVAAQHIELAKLAGTAAGRDEGFGPTDARLSLLGVLSSRLRELQDSLHCFLDERTGQDSFLKRRST